MLSDEHYEKVKSVTKQSRLRRKKNAKPVKPPKPRVVGNLIAGEGEAIFFPREEEFKKTITKNS